jgi:hypothetical protein
MTISMCYAFQDRGEKISPKHSGGAGYEAASYIINKKIIEGPYIMFLGFI